MERRSKRNSNKDFNELETKRTSIKNTNRTNIKNTNNIKSSDQSLGDDCKHIKEAIFKENNNCKNQNNIWIKKDTVIVCDFGTTPSDKILGLDMDDTLISIKSSNKFPVNSDDWILLFDKNKMVEKLNSYLSEGYKIVIFTNQKGISLGKTKENDITKKIENIQKTLGIPLIAFIATDGDYYRKPSIGMWKLLFEQFNSDIKIANLNKSIYVGDAAGRLKNSSMKKDHSNFDYLFALNIKVDFKIPEAFFGGARNDYGKIEFDPKKLKLNEQNFDLRKIIESLPGKQDIIIFCGSPGSGKTNMYHSHLKNLGYEHVNQDQLKTELKCVKVATELLSQGKGVCIDSTNPSKIKRKVFIELAKNLGVTIRCFFFKMDKDLVFHLNNLRNINNFRIKYTKSVADVVIHTWFKYLEIPDTIEGFKEVHEINFVPGPFENDEDEELFYCYS